MPYLWNEKRFCKNSNGFEFHVDRYKTGEISAKIGEYFFLPSWKGETTTGIETKKKLKASTKFLAFYDQIKFSADLNLRFKICIEK